MGKVLIALLLCLAIGAACSGGGSGVSPSGSPSTSASPRSSVHSGGAAVSPTQAATGELPSRELMDLAQRFRGLSADTPRIARTSPYGHAVGDSAKFTLLNLTAPGLYTVTATVRRVTDHAYFFVQDDVMYGDPALDKISSDFESTVWPTVTGDFGEPWTPGVDSDPRITILHAKLNGAGGYFSQSDEYPVVVAADSNEREMVYLDAGTLGNPGPGYNSLLAHELQHLIHWHADPTEEAWVNEGLSQVSAEEVGGGLEWLQSFLEQPDTQLTYWPALEDSGIHYAESELFNAYVLDHYGGRAKAKELLAKQGDGIDGINEYLAPYGKTFAGVFADWVVANYLAQPEGLYSNTKIRSAVTAITNVGPGPGDSTVHQFGSDYLLITNPVP